MKIMIDTNILISAALFPGGKAAQAFYKAISFPYEPVVCDYIIEELKRKFEEKFPDKASDLDVFLHIYASQVEVINTPTDIKDAEEKIRDYKDRPILRAALEHGVDLFLTGDKDFLESSVTDPRIISAATFLSDFYE